MSNPKPHHKKCHEDSAVIWDLPLRLFHWSLSVAVVGAVATSKVGTAFWHEKMGLTVLGLLVFRIIWGFIGSYHARFANFLVRPKQVMAYLKGRLSGNRDHVAGHSPTGGYATMVLILVLLVMAILGSMSHDNILYEAPLARYVGAFSDNARYYHHLLEKVVYAVVGLHVVAIIFYRLVLKIGLTKDMVGGGRDASRPPLRRAHQIGGVVLLLAMVGLAQSLGLMGDRF